MFLFVLLNYCSILSKLFTECWNYNNVLQFRKERWSKIQPIWADEEFKQKSLKVFFAMIHSKLQLKQEIQIVL